MTNVKTATSIDEQIKKLRDCGMEIGLTQVSKAQDALLDIGYYRLAVIGFLLKRHHLLERDTVTSSRKELFLTMQLNCIISISTYGIFYFDISVA